MMRRGFDIVEVLWKGYKLLFLFGINMLIYISFNLHVLYGICNSLQDKDTSQEVILYKW